MSFSLSGLFSNHQVQNTNSSQTPQVNRNTEGTVSVPATSVLNVTNGSQISGEVVSVSGKDVIIQIGPEQQLATKLSADLNVEIGQQLTFEVQKGMNGQIALRALYANLDVNPTALKALDMANIPVKENTIAMVDAMMKEGMSIDSESLQTMYHEIVKNPEAGGNTIVQLARLGIPITNENISQFESYINFNHQISGAVGEIAEGVSELTQTFYGTADDFKALQLNNLVLDLFAGSDVDWIAEVTEEAAPNNAVKEQATSTGTGVQTEAELAENKTVNTEAELSANTEAKGMNEVLTTKEMNSLLTMTNQLGLTDEITHKIADGTVSARQFLSLLNQMIGQIDAFGTNTDKAAMKQLLLSPVYEKLLTSQMKEELSLKPEEMLSKEKVQRLYDNIQNKMAGLAQNLPELGESTKPLMQSVNYLQNNLDFMQQINHMANYVQLPLKMNGQDANGELYVYTNKKNLAQKDGNISAFLHLDMTHLGPVDVYVSMQGGEHVNTHFYLASDEMIDFISEHLPILDERLEARGYHMNAVVTQKEKGKPFDVLDEVKKVKNSEGSISSKIASYAFDVRA